MAAGASDGLDEVAVVEFDAEHRGNRYPFRRQRPAGGHLFVARRLDRRGVLLFVAGRDHDAGHLLPLRKQGGAPLRDVPGDGRHPHAAPRGRPAAGGHRARARAALPRLPRERSPSSDALPHGDRRRTWVCAHTRRRAVRATRPRPRPRHVGTRHRSRHHLPLSPARAPALSSPRRPPRAF